MKNQRMQPQSITQIIELINKGVTIPNPESVYISDDVDLNRISSDNVTLYAGTKIIGNRALIMKNSQIGYETPVTLENTLVGENCRLNGGFFKDTVFAGDNVFGSGAHVREGTILEEQANAAHTVGLKQTILFPFVTLGSLINFCDCFMAGGTSRKNHSEVGSSFIHFNYTPNQDKATPSMMGDVSSGVMLCSKPIFLGGQGGLVGPLRINYGCISAAGSILRKNELNQDQLILGGGFKNMSMARQPDVYTNVAHIFNNNICYIAELIALHAWYTHVRTCFIDSDLSAQLMQGMQENLLSCINERIKRFKVFGEKLEKSKSVLVSRTPDKITPAIGIHDQALEKIKKALPIFENRIQTNGLDNAGSQFIQKIREKIRTYGKTYIPVIQRLDPSEQDLGVLWLKAIENSLINDLLI